MISPYEAIIRLLLGAVFGGIIGFERQSHGRPAGFRTHLLVCVASVLIMMVSVDYYRLSSIDNTFIRIDPARIAAGAITGVGFLGAGVIIKSGFTIQGLTTAACLWIVSAIGLAVGSGLYIQSLISFLITFFSLWILRKLESRVSRLKHRLVTIVAETEELIDPYSIFKPLGIDVSEVDYEIDRVKAEVIYHVHIAYKRKELVLQLIDKLRSLKEIKRISIRG
jgi:putative Mg2+ transporter-C (MgtC) family protein